MKHLIFCLALLLSYPLAAQTKLIAYKSHAGDLDFFIPDAQPEDDYGMPPPRIVKIEKVNDSTIVETSDVYWNGRYVTDTVVHHPYFSNPELSLETIKKRYRKDVEFLGFEQKLRKEKKKGKQSKQDRQKPQSSPKAAPIAPLQDSSTNKKLSPAPQQTPRTRAIVPIAVDQQPPKDGGTSNWPLLLGLVAVYLLSLSYLVYKKQQKTNTV